MSLYILPEAEILLASKTSLVNWPIAWEELLERIDCNLANLRKEEQSLSAYNEKVQSRKEEIDAKGSVFGDLVFRERSAEVTYEIQRFTCFRFCLEAWAERMNRWRQVTKSEFTGALSRLYQLETRFFQLFTRDIEMVLEVSRNRAQTRKHVLSIDSSVAIAVSNEEFKHCETPYGREHRQRECHWSLYLFHNERKVPMQIPIYIHEVMKLEEELLNNFRSIHKALNGERDPQYPVYINDTLLMLKDAKLLIEHSHYSHSLLTAITLPVEEVNRMMREKKVSSLIDFADPRVATFARLIQAGDYEKAKDYLCN
jgi:hypothetical protein